MSKYRLVRIFLALLFVLITKTSVWAQDSQIISIKHTASDIAFDGLSAFLSSSPPVWHKLNQPEFNGGFSKQQHWFQLAVSVNEPQTVLVIGYPLLDFIDVYVKQPSGLFQEYHVGDLRSPLERPVKDRNFVIPLPQADEPLSVLVAVKSSGSVYVPFSTHQLTEYREASIGKQVLIYVTLGILMLMVIYNLFIYLSVRDIAYLYYSCFVSSLALLTASLNGLPPLLFPHALMTDLNSLLPISLGLTTIFASVFANKFISVMHYNKLLYRWNQLFVVYGSVVVLSGLTWPYDIATLLAIAGVVISCPALAFTGIYVWHKGNRSARFYVVGWGCLLAGAVLVAAQRLGYADFAFAVDNFLLKAAIFEAIILSLALADRINTLKREKLDAQHRALEQEKSLRAVQQQINSQLEEKVSERTRLLASKSDELSKLNASLEAKVEERTKELNVAFNKLADQHKKLKAVKLQLVQNEKMSALGTLVSGISHEMNNPVNFAYNGMKHLETKLHEFSAYLDSLVNEEEKDVKASFDDYFASFEAETAVITDGLARVTSLIKDLQAFYRQNDGAMKPCNIVKGLQSTLALVRSHYQHSVDIQVAFDSESEVRCDISRMNQVFMNLLMNACEATEEKTYSAGERPAIYITTTQYDGTFEIIVEDNGVGIDKSLSQRIYDPFFTTKSHKNGTGLGLAVAYEIVHAHGGSIQCDSVVGKGSQFKVLLPLHVVSPNVT